MLTLPHYILTCNFTWFLTFQSFCIATSCIHIYLCGSVRLRRHFYGLTTVYSCHTLTSSFIQQIFEYLPCPRHYARHGVSTVFILFPHRGQ